MPSVELFGQCLHHPPPGLLAIAVGIGQSVAQRAALQFGGLGLQRRAGIAQGQQLEAMPAARGSS